MEGRELSQFVPTVIYLIVLRPECFSLREKNSAAVQLLYCTHSPLLCGLTECSCSVAVVVAIDDNDDNNNNR